MYVALFYFRKDKNATQNKISTMYGKDHNRTRVKKIFAQEKWILKMFTDINPKKER